ncbi:putative ATP-dependent RNA helicase DDX60 [Mustelus asterias]
MASGDADMMEGSSGFSSDSESEAESVSGSEEGEEEEEEEEAFSDISGEEEAGLALEEAEAELESGPGPGVDTELPADLQRQVKFLNTISNIVLSKLSKAECTSLLHDSVESEFFVIDGDSLMIEHVLDSNFCEGQNLHFFYLVERFLFDITQKGAKYVIVFFKDAECMWARSSYHLSLRTALILHLKNNTEVPVYAEFVNSFSSKWQEFVKEKYPYFIMISDKAFTLTGNKGMSSYLLKIFVFHTLGSEINVAMTSGMHSDVRRLYGYYVNSKAAVTRCKKTQKAMEPAHRAVVSFLSQNHATKLLLGDGQNSKSVSEEVQRDFAQLQCLWPDGSDIRRSVCVVSCSVALKCYMRMLKNGENHKGTETACNKSKDESLTFQEAADVCRMYCAHVALMLHLPLAKRAQKKVSVKWIKPASDFLQLLYLNEHFILKNLDITKNWRNDLVHLCDLNDKLLLTRVALCSKMTDHTDSSFLGEVFENEYKQMWDAVSSLMSDCDIGNAFPFQATSKMMVEEDDSLQKEGLLEVIPDVGFIPVNIPLVEEYVGDALKDFPMLSSDSSVVTSLSENKTFDILSDWSLDKPLSDDYERTKASTFGEKTNDPYVRKRMLRSYQKLVRFHRFYGSTLEGNITKNIITNVQGCITVAPKQSSVISGKGKKLPPKKKADLIAEENIRKKKEKEDQKQREQWTLISKSIMKMIQENFDHGIKKLEEFLKKCSGDSVKLIAEMDVLENCFKIWVEHCQMTESAKRNNLIAGRVMKRIHNILDKYEKMMEKNQLKLIASYLKEFGFHKLAQCIPDIDQKLARPKNPKKENMLAVGVEPARFQLKYMGPYLLRDERNDPDPRVSHFIPDTWQRELLDAVDNNESAVIVAPTSSGKTYASYYCMEKVLRDSDDGVLVYIAPTKALVNQVVATVYNRFSKTLPDGMVVCGVYTRDYRQDALNCQILITIPQCLENLILNAQRQAWVKKLKYVIFDEVHCLGGEIGAEVWEHLLVMIRCPFLALSATISKPEALAQWLQAVKNYWQRADKTLENPVKVSGGKKKQQMKMPRDQRSYRVKLVVYGERYNDLEKYVCSSNESGFDFVSYHPCAALTVDHIETYGFPSDLSLSPPESLRLYDTMAETWTSWPRAQEFSPEEYQCFKDKIVIKKNDVRKYEAELKQELEKWITSGQKEQASEVLEKLKPTSVVNSTATMVKQFPMLVEALQKENQLPALFFSFSVSVVERLAKETFVHVTNKEQMKRGSDDAKKRIEFENKLRKLSKRAGKKQPSDPKESSLSDNMVMKETEQEMLYQKLQEMRKIPPDCTYAVETAADRKILDTIFQRLQVVKTANQLRLYLERGIGFHHASLNSKGRQAVEMLFRLGFARVVTATGTLALGINMPCKTVVFLDDSVFLDALQYRQMSGRAGRRGFDLIGNVVFYSVPMPKVQRLLKASVPLLSGQFPLSASLVLRLLLLVAKAEDTMDAKAKALSLLQHSMLCYDNKKKQLVLKLYFLSCLQFLLKGGFVDVDGTPQGFAELVTQLHYHEPANFVFVSFLVKGLFHKICCQLEKPAGKGLDRFSDETMESLLLVLSNLFGRMYLPACSTEKDWATLHQSKVFLEDLPEEFADAVNEYNKTIQEIFGCFLISASNQADMVEECHLPLSRISFESAQPLQTCTKFVTELTAPENHPTTAVSPFTCLSGITNLDLFKTYNVDNIALRTLELSSSNIPVLNLIKYDQQGRRMPLNAYALDFYRHGSLKALLNDNMLHLGEAYNVLNEFQITLSSISTSLKELCDNKEDVVVLAFEQLRDTFYQKFEKIKS